MLARHQHLSTANTRADIGQAIVITQILVLVVGEGLTRLRGEMKHARFRFLVGADQCAAAGGRDHLVAVETQHSETAEGPEGLAVKPATKRLGAVFHDRNTILVGNGKNPIHLVRHAVERHGHDGLGRAAGLCNAIFDDLFQQVRVDVPSILFAVHENGFCAKIANRIDGCAEGESLGEDFVSGFHAAANETQVDGSRT